MGTNMSDDRFTLKLEVQCKDCNKITTTSVTLNEPIDFTFLLEDARNRLERSHKLGNHEENTIQSKPQAV